MGKEYVIEELTENSFDKDWEEVKKVNKEIRKVSLYDNSVKSLLTVDLW